MKKRILILGLITLNLSLSSVVHPQTQDRTLPKLLSVREQKVMRESWLKKRLDTMLLPMMRQQKIDMWIVTNEEFHADPVTEYIAPPIPYVGRRDFFIFADRGGDKLDRVALVRYPEEALKSFFEVWNPPGKDIAATSAQSRRRTQDQKPSHSTWAEHAVPRLALHTMRTTSWRKPSAPTTRLISSQPRH